MEPLPVVCLLFGGFLLLGLVIRLIAGAFDTDRVEQYVAQQGGELLERTWAPFGPGWFGDKHSRIYRITYRDREGNVHEAHVKTSMLGGVYLTDDQIVERAKRPPQPEEETLADENRRLRERLRELEQDKS